MTSDRSDERDTTFEPDWGLGAVADPVLFGESLLDLGRRLARDPASVARVGTKFVAGLAETGYAVASRTLGVAAEGPVAVDSADARFRDPAWDANSLFFGLRQAYLLWSDAMRELAAAADDDGELAQKAEYVVSHVIDALAPTNFLPGNPTALKRAFETGGASLARGFRQFLDAVATNGGWPRQVDARGFTLGKDLAATPGKVVFRNRLIELIQFEPTTETVFEVPLVLSPPWINKYYVMDLAPGKSFAQWAIDHGHTVFAISYHNPDASSRDLGIEDYLREGLLAALEVASEITGSGEVNVAALCLGGTLTAVALAHLAGSDAPGPRVRSATLLNTLVDFSDPGDLGHFVDETTVRRLEARMAKQGFLPADQMAGTFNLLRANDLIWRYVVSGWLMGEDPPAFDILAWNDDSTRMPARMHSEYLRFMYLQNRLAKGTLEIDGTPVALRASEADVYVLSAREDHITPWRGCYRTAALVGGAVRFVLTSSGHIAGIVNPPGPKRIHWLNDALPDDPDEWLSGATEVQGSWWEDWAPWIGERGGPRRKPPSLGSKAHPPLGDAPGTYVLG